MPSATLHTVRMWPSPVARLAFLVDAAVADAKAAIARHIPHIHDHDMTHGAGATPALPRLPYRRLALYTCRNEFGDALLPFDDLSLSLSPTQMGLRPIVDVVVSCCRA